jgi:amino acid adenylation domain-containing protein
MQNPQESQRATPLTPARRALLEKWRQGKVGPRSEPERAPGPAPLSFQQQRLWFLHQLEPEVATYTMAGAVRLTGELHIQALEQSLTLLIQRHEPLRTCFPSVDGQPVQQILPSAPVHLAVVDPGALPIDAQRSEESALLQHLASRPVALASGPLFRTCLLRLTPRCHVLALCMHHTLYDGLSLTIFLRELAEAYRATLAQGAPALSPLLLTYADYATWQRAHLQSELLAELTAFWQAHLQGAPQVLKIPGDRPRPPQQTHHGARLRLPMAASLARQVHRWSQQEGVTPFMVALAAFALLMARYSGQRDLLLGTPVANRPRPAFAALIGFFANLLVLRARLVGNPTFRAFVQQMRATVLQALAHQELPFEHLVDILQPPRSLSAHPLVQVVFSLDELAPAPRDVPGLQMEFALADSGLSPFDLVVSLQLAHGEIEIEAQYNTDLFDETTIGRLLRHYLHLLASGLQQPERRVYELPLLSEEERFQALSGWNETRATFAQTRGIHELLEQQVQRTPDALALVMDDCALTYQELDRRAEQLAAFLCTQGVGPEQIVGLCLQRSPETIIGLLGILKAGGAYLPLDPTYPAARLAFLLADSQVSLVLSRRAHALPSGVRPARLLNLEDCPPLCRPAPRAQIWPDHLAYVIYTSGSTAQPRAVAITQRGLCNLVGALGRTCALGPGARVLQFASLNFDASVLECFGALAHGACLVLAGHEALLPGPPLQATLQRQAITLTLLPPSTLAALPGEALLPTLQTLIVGGEACPQPLVAARAGGRVFLNAYGPTEASVCITMARCQPDQALALGRPLHNMQLYILDAALEPVPPGVCGEIYLGGSGLARGYLGRPEVTAAHFLPHPFSSQGGARLYRSGDLARYDSEGTITFLGRADDQVKLRGLRVEPAEIAAVLRTLPAVHDAVVLVSSSEQGDKELVACLAIPQEHSGTTASVLRQQLRAHLPDYLLPARFLLLPALPGTPQGKLDRHALQELAASGGEREQPRYHAPRTPLERVISATWQDVLQVARIGRTDNFFDLGGHSLALVRVHSELQTRLQREIALLDLFHYPTVEALAHYLREGATTLPLQESQARARTRKTTPGRRRATPPSRPQAVQESEHLPHA